MIYLSPLITENFQLAKKLYIDTGKLTAEDVTFLVNICDKTDYIFKTLADLLVEDKTSHVRWRLDHWRSVITQLRAYNQNVLPKQGFGFDSTVPSITKQDLDYREEIIRILSTWPIIAKRNLKSDIRKPRSSFKHLKETVEYINSMLSLLDNRSETSKSIIYKKIFNSNHPTFESVLEFVEDKENLMSDTAFTKEQLYTIVADNDYDLKIIYDKNNIVIVDVTGQPGIKAIGCNSVWCFTYGNEYGKAGEQWDQYSYNGHVYAIINFRETQSSPEFIHIVTKPFKFPPESQKKDPNQLEFPIKYSDEKEEEEEDYEYDNTGVYDMSNQQVYGNPYMIVSGLVNGDEHAVKLFTFDEI